MAVNWKLALNQPSLVDFSGTSDSGRAVVLSASVFDSFADEVFIVHV
jgi:hypothetical protein